MYDIKMKHHFIELRAKGWSLSRCADHLHVSRRTLVDWNREFQGNIALGRALELEALQEKLLASHEAELARLAKNLEDIEAELAQRDHKFDSTTVLFRMAALLRNQIRQTRIEPDFNPPPTPPVPPAL